MQATPIPKNASAAMIFSFVSGAVLRHYSESRGDRLIPIVLENDGRAAPPPVSRDCEYFMINVDNSCLLTRVPSDMRYILEQNAVVAHLDVICLAVHGYLCALRRYPCQLHLSRRSAPCGFDIIADGPTVAHLNVNAPIQVTLSTTNGDEKSFRCLECGMAITASVSTRGQVTLIHSSRPA